MSERNRGLGRGLSALLSESEADHDEAEAREDVKKAAEGASTIPIELIRPNPAQPRRVFNKSDLAELANSIREKGVLQPLLLRPASDGEGYEIVAGERRWRAAQKAGQHSLPAVIRELSDAETLEIAIIENVQRADLSPLEEAEAYRRLMDEFDRTQANVADVVGKSRAHVANTMRLLNLPESVRKLVGEGKLSAGHARALLGAEDPEALAKRAVAENLSVRAVEALARKPGAAAAPKKSGGRSGGNSGKDPDTLALESDVAASLGLEVDIRHADEGGEVRISYKSLEQLDDLCRRLTG